MQAAAIFGVLLFAVEMFLLLCFISAYYRSGIVLFKERCQSSALAAGGSRNGRSYPARGCSPRNRRIGTLQGGGACHS